VHQFLIQLEQVALVEAVEILVAQGATVVQVVLTLNTGYRR
jgi:hypothetical protein